MGSFSNSVEKIKMKRRRQSLSDDEYEPEVAPQKKRRRRSKSTTNSNTKSKNTNSSSSKKKRKKKAKPSKQESSGSDSESSSLSEVSSISEDCFDENELKWSCNVIRGKIRKLLETPGFKVTPWLKGLNVNSNSYRRFMKLKGAWNGTQNGTYLASYRYFLKQDKIKKKKQEKLKKKPLSERKR